MGMPGWRNGTSLLRLLVIISQLLQCRCPLPRISGADNRLSSLSSGYRRESGKLVDIGSERKRRGGGMVDAKVSKTFDPKGHAGSIPAPGTL